MRAGLLHSCDVLNTGLHAKRHLAVHVIDKLEREKRASRERNVDVWRLNKRGTVVVVDVVS